MIDEKDYQYITDKLGLGEFRKVPHIGCSNSNCLRIEHKVEGYQFYCFKCREPHFVSRYNSPKERLKRKTAYDALMRYKASRSYELPADFSHTIASRGLAWLGKGGWTSEMISRYNIGWSEELQRVILPVVDNCIHYGYTARAVNNEQPKYLEKVQAGALWPSLNSNIDCNKAVVTEDILSAGRCGEFIQSYSMLGTTLSTPQIARLIKHSSLFLFLDPDRAGISASQKIAKRLRLLCNVRIIKSKADPKLLTDNELRSLLCMS